jgi:hypothetical protein
MSLETADEPISARSHDPSVIPPLPSAVAPYRRPGVLLGVYAYRALTALVLAAPVAMIAQDLVGDRPRGDAELFEPGAILLVEALRLGRPALSSLPLQTAILVVLIGFVGLVPLAALIHALSRPGRVRFRGLAGAVGQHLGTLALLLGLALLAQAAASALLIIGGGSIIRFAGWSGPSADFARVGVGLLAGIAAVVLGVVHDLARVSAIHYDQGLYNAAARALRTFRGAKLRAIGAYAWRGLLAIGVLVGAALLGRLAGVETAKDIAVAAAIHQGAVLAAVYLRASWLTAAMRLTEREAARERALELALAHEEPAPEPAPQVAAAAPPEVTDALDSGRAILPLDAPSEAAGAAAPDEAKARPEPEAKDPTP